MELILQQNLPHQQKAINAVCDSLEGVAITPPIQFYENPQINLADGRLPANLRSLQSDIPTEFRMSPAIDSCLNLDVKMETGTGKTYVYTKTIYELHKRYGFNKFIIVVPSLAIKAGIAQFLKDEYSRRHFTDGCGYRSEIELGVLEAPKNKKKGRSYFPGVVSDFIKGSSQISNKIYVLLVNMQLLTSNSKRQGRDTGMLWRDDYDYGAEGFYRPFDALRAAKPIVIIDEPHRFSREQKAFQAIMSQIQPQAVIRYGATFPEITIGQGRFKRVIKDYQYLLYDLNACKSFNQGLIKGVAKEHFEPSSRRDEKVKILSIDRNKSVTFQLKKRNETPRTFTLGTGESLAIINDAFAGISILAVTANTVEFSNGVTKTKGEEMDVDIYMTSYQEQMIRLALKRHFETEREHFCNRTFKIKTLALFFIDDISSYRPNADGRDPYLLTAFERLLKERIQTTIESLKEQEQEYRAYLEASLENISACHAGYFSQDNSDSDEDIAKEVDIILNGKKQLLSFRNPDGSFNTLRFLFSKWTLKEGWDNPNVFTIAKLRSSGSEISKLQEVGRGLRLPVDENGNRISNEDFQLNYIVDFTEADFAQRLVDQINSEIPHAVQITEARLCDVAHKLGMTADDLFDELYNKHYIDRNKNIRPETRNQFLEEYPLFESGLSSGKIKDRNREVSRPVKIRKAAYTIIKELWERINQRYLLFYDKDIDSKIEEDLLSLFEKPNVFTVGTMSSHRDIVQSNGVQMFTMTGSGDNAVFNHPIPYGAFLKQIMRFTNIPITTLHNAIVQYVTKHGALDPMYINENSVSAFCLEFQNWKMENLQGMFRYVKSATSSKATALSYADGTPREEIAQGRIGTKIVEGDPSSKYLYDVYAYDSPLERDNITAEIEEVIVYGKIPRNSIAIPTITGGMFSPDFIYVVRKSNGEKELNIVVETKDVEGRTDLRGNEKVKIECARVFFDILSRDGYVVHFRDQLNNKQIAQIIIEVLNS
ncbi:MAG: type III restriction-modification system endonuclease [Thermoguttaceae bacterium]|nr:type III restriction-modification system endonuclease [Thermoguttaceae bacterium]